MELVKNTHGQIMNTRACRKHTGPCRKLARTKEYLIDLVENTSLQNPHTPAHVSPSCDFTCDWPKLNVWPTPWQHGLSPRGSLVAISHAIGLNWPNRLSSASRITYWLAIAYRQVNKLFFRLSVYLRMRSRHKNDTVKATATKLGLRSTSSKAITLFKCLMCLVLLCLLGTL